MTTIKLVATSRAITHITMPKLNTGVNPARSNQSGADRDRQLSDIPRSRGAGAARGTAAPPRDASADHSRNLDRPRS